MKKEWEAPEITILALAAENVITTSGGDRDPDDEDIGEWD